jgi:hypothetical protein
MRSRVDDAEIRGSTMRQANKMGISSQSISGNYAIPPGAPHVQEINSGASTNRNVTLPANPKKGDWFILLNTGSGTSVLTIQDSAAGALVPARTLAINVAVLVWWNGTAWKAGSYS